MKTIILCSALAICLLNGAQSENTTKTSEFRCHRCEKPGSCGVLRQKVCAAGEDACVKYSLPVAPAINEDIANLTYNVIGRGCMKWEKCEKKRAKSTRVKVHCCQEDCCNA